jgi:hypothetical protein
MEIVLQVLGCGSKCTALALPVQMVQEWSNRLGSSNNTLKGGWVMTDQLTFNVIIKENTDRFTSVDPEKVGVGMASYRISIQKLE